MDEVTSATTAQERPPVGSEEWVKQTLNKAAQDTTSEESAIEPQGTAPDAEVAETPVVPVKETALNWREVPIPEDDEEVPQHFRGKPTGEFYKGYRELERQFNTDRERMRQLEAKVAAQETLKEFLQEARSSQQPSAPPSDPYKEAGLDLEVDSVLNPTKFFPEYEKIVLNKADQVVQQRLNESKEKDRQEQEQKRQYELAQQGVGTLFQSRKLDKLTEKERERRIGTVLFQSSFENKEKGVEAIFNPNTLLEIYDTVFPGPPREAVAASNPPDPPGAKRPAAIDSSKPPGPQLKSYEREAALAAADQLRRAGFTGVDNERLMARFAANLKGIRK